MIAIDTNVLLYSVDRNEPAKQHKAQLLLQQLEISTVSVVLPWQVLGETAQQLRRWHELGRITLFEYTRNLSAFRHLFPLALPTAETFDRALTLAQHYSLSHWDSMLLGACQTAGVTRLYTEDMGAPRTIESIELVNPFT